MFGYATLSPQLALPSFCWLTDAVEGLARAGIEGATLGTLRPRPHGHADDA